MAWTTPGTAVASTVLTASFWNTHVRDNTNALYTTVQRIGYQENTSGYSVLVKSLGSAANIFSSNITWTAAGSTSYRIEFYTPIIMAAAGAATVSIYLVDGSGADLGRMAYFGPSSSTSATYAPGFCAFYYTPSAGSVTINARAIATGNNSQLYGGSGGSGNYTPMWLGVFGPPLT